MGRLLKFLLRLFLAFAFIVLIVSAALRGWAALRETADAREGHEAALFVSAGGLDLHYGEWGPPDGRVLLLIPGALAWSQTWRDIALPLGEAGYRTVALDLPPFGYSERPADGNLSRPALAGIIVDFADSLGLDRFVLVGHSFGGGATIEVAMDAPDRVEALVLLDVALGLQAPEGSGAGMRSILSLPPLRTALAAATFANPLFTGMGLRGFIHDDAIVTEERIALYQAPLSVAGTSAAIGNWLLTGLYGDEREARSASRDAYRRIERPTLVIWGREDTVTPLTQGEDIAELIPGAELVVLDGVDHIPHVEAPGATVDAIVGFLERNGGQIVAPGKQDRLEPTP